MYCWVSSFLSQLKSNIQATFGRNNKAAFISSAPIFYQTLLLGLKYEDLSWDFGKPPNASDDPECLPCLFIQVRKFVERLIKDRQ